MTLPSHALALALAALAWQAADSAVTPDRSTNLPAIDTSGFASSRHHWLSLRDTNRFIHRVPVQPEYAPTQVREIVTNILLFQRENGGWPKDYDMLAILTEEQRAKVQATKKRADTSFDNGNLHSQVQYLARAYAAAGEPAWRDACLRGFDFILAAQYPNGGFPQRYPHPTDFHAHITFNDYVMIGALNALGDAAVGSAHFTWLDAPRRERARDAVRRGVDCILKCQIQVNGKPTGWCQQHDERTYQAAPGRTFELASICPQDTTEILRFLMRLEAPGQEVVRAIDAAVEWLRATRLSGVRVERVKAAPVKFERHDADFDVVVVRDEKAPALWARHYEIGTDRPIFAGRDGVKRYALAEIERERRTGTPWYGNWPQAFLERDYPQWKARLKNAK